MSGGLHVVLTTPRLVVPNTFNAVVYDASYGRHNQRKPKWKCTWQEWIESTYIPVSTLPTRIIEGYTVNTLKALETLKATIVLQEVSIEEAARLLNERST